MPKERKDTKKSTKVSSGGDAAWSMIGYITPKIVGELIKVVHTRWNHKEQKGHTEISVSNASFVRYISINDLYLTKIAEHSEESKAAGFHLNCIKEIDFYIKQTGIRDNEQFKSVH